MADRAGRLLEVIGRASALLRAGRHRHPLKMRMHPLDIQALERKYVGGESDWNYFDPRFRPLRVMGIPVEPDDAVVRGAPVIEYAEDRS